MANKRFIDFPIATTVGDNDIILIWQGGANKQTTKATILSGVPDSLNDLTDVTISGLTNGQILRYDSVTGQWENTDQGNLDLNDLNDVTIVSPTNGQVLVYNSSTSKWENSSGGYVPYVGAVTTVDLGLQGLEAGYVRFDTSIVSVPDEQGLMYWDASRSTVALIMNGTLQHIGQDTFFYVKNSSGSSIPKGTCVRFAGTDGASGHLLITPFLANGSVPSTYFLGVTAETITNGSFGQVMHFGELEGINTSSYTAGDLLYASTTVAGAFQTTAPVAPNNIVLVAAAVNSKNNGAIVVRPTYGSNINNDEGVKITSPTTGDLLQLQAGGLWENKTIDAAGIVTKATNQTITGVKTFSQDIMVNGVNVGRGASSVATNTILGFQALVFNTTGSSNTSVGYSSLYLNTTGSSNSSFGTLALENNIIGSFNTAIGYQALQDNTSSSNTAIGYLASSQNTSGSANFSGGARALENTTTGSFNTSIGFASLQQNTTGGGNVAIGEDAGRYTSVTSVGNTNGNDSVFIGRQSKPLGDSQTNQIVIGHQAIGGGSNTVVIGNSSILSNRFFGTMRIGTINNGVGDYITTDANGVLTKRTGAEVRTDIGAGTVTSVAALTLGTSGTDLSSTVANATTTPVITLNVPTASATNRGALSAADWTTFNNKQNALTNPVTGTGTTNYLPKFTGTSTIGNSNLINDASGNLGLGVTPSAWIGATGLQVQYATVEGRSSIPSFAEYGANTFSESGVRKYITSDFASRYTQFQSNHYWFTAPSGTAGNAISFTQAMTLFATGNLLVGSPSPISDNGARLQVSGTATFSSSVTATSFSISPFSGYNGQFDFTGGTRISQTTPSTETSDSMTFVINGGSTSTTGNAFIFKTQTGNISPLAVLTLAKTGAATFDTTSAISAIFNSTNASGGYLAFRRSGTNIGYLGNSAQLGIGVNNALELRADNNLYLTTTSGTLAMLSNGNVGIGTQSPTSGRLEIQQTTTTAALWVQTGGTTSSYIIADFRTGTNASALKITGNGNVGLSRTYDFTTSNAANVYIDSGEGFLYRSTSSIKYKTNVKNYDKGLDVLSKMRPVYYEGIGNLDLGKMFAGLIAEEIHELGLTEFVQYANDGSPDALAYQNMVALLIKAIQELKQEIDTLKS